MSKLFSFSRTQVIIIITVSVMLILGAAYIFIYIPNHKRRVEELRFRCLQNVQANIKAKRDNSVALLKNLLVTHMLNRENYDRRTLRNYISEYSMDNFTLMQPSPAKGVPGIDTEIKNIPDHTLEAIDAKYADNVMITLIHDQLNIFLTKGEYSIGMKYTLNQFFGTLLPLDTYDQYLVLLDTSIIYQTFETGITKIQADSLPTRQGAFSRDQVKDVVIGGTQYKLFAQQLNLDKASVLTVIGLLKKQTYQEEKNELPGNVVIFLMIISITTILILPWIKLYQIGGQDRLTAADGMLTFPIAMLFISILFFTSFKYNFGFGRARPNSEDSKKKLAAELESAFMRDVKQAYNDLTLLDKRFRECSRKESLTGENVIPGLGMIKKIFNERNIDRVFWLDGSGHELASWTSFAQNAPAGIFSNREYFKNIKVGKPFFLKKGEKSSMYLEPVISWVSGKFVSAISKPSGEDTIAAMSFNLKTSDQSILPSGLSYCIIDEKGKVLYHSNSSRNLNEDLFSELTEPETLRSSVLARSNVFFKSSYRGKRYDIYAKSFDNLPFYVVVFEDTQMKVNRDMNVSYFCFFMLLVLFLIIIVELLLVFLLSYQSSYFKKHYFDISWIGPDVRFHNQYVLSIGWNILNILLLWVIYNYVHFLEFLAIQLVSVTTIVLFLNYQYQFFYKNKQADTAKFKTWVSWALIGMILFITLIALFFLPKCPVSLLIYELCLIMLIGIIRVSRYKWEWILDKRWRFQPVRDLSHSFSVMVFSALIITSGIPVAVLFIVSNTQELKMLARYRHKQFADELIRQYPTLGYMDVQPAAKSSKIKIPNAFSDGNWIKDVAIVNTLNFETSRDTEFVEKARLDTMYYQLIPYHADVTPNLSEFNHSSSTGYSYYYDDGLNITYLRLQSGNYLRITSTRLQYENSLDIANNKKNALLYLSVFALTLFACWAILHQILRKLFAMDFPAQDYWNKVDDLILSKPDLNSLLFILGAPGSGKMRVIKKMLADNKFPRLVKKEDSDEFKSVPVTCDDYEELDLFQIPENLDDEEVKEWKKSVSRVYLSEKPLIIVNHFEYDIKNPATNHYKLELLEKLMQKKDSKIMIVSTVHPMHFLDSLSNQLQPGKPSESLTQNDRERWQVILGHFRIVVHQLKVGTWEDAITYPQGLRILSEETNHGHFLVKMQDPIQTEFKKMTALTNAEGSGVAAKIGISAHYFYTYVWQSLTKEEKFLLYDLAEDGLINPYDDYNITILISKGLIIRKNGLLKLFNEGFRNFILTAIGNSEVRLIRNQIRESGNWGKLKTPLTVIAVAVLVFLYASQNEVYSEIIKYVGVITVVVPTVYKIFGALESVFAAKNLLGDRKSNTS
ncbi:cache domain-containing protein [Dyadobacter sandarakinus]|uniref:Cache domain-containing protein n=1 Tax=Dyadobacter sandarakinus TaxID=2747268 RepID=A0ABX7I6Q9_9BACT|nr:cache domain-containing protein [Dyadobacter sandarakinus]QRR01480.1 cache domain-containing protein [Dyadobacter sandarakinus]